MALILGIETSCDETAAGVVEDSRRILSNVVASQVAVHAQYGGVFPEIASREHILKITTVLEQALSDANISWRDLHAIAVTFGPGLAGSLLVGVNAAKGAAYAEKLPFIGINHLEGHIYANWLSVADLHSPAPSTLPPPQAGGQAEQVGKQSRGARAAAERPDEPPFPLIALVVSGGHSELVLMRAHGNYRLLGRTIDDAAGEAFDKVARLLGLGYPGGPAIQKAAESGAPNAFSLPRAWLKGTYDFSFSGLKTAMLHLVNRFDRPEHIPVADVAASFQHAVADVLVEKTLEAAHEFGARAILLAGGVAANSHLRALMRERADVPVLIPPPELCIDNGAMIAAAAWWHYQKNERSGWDLDVVPSLRLAEEREQTTDHK